VWCIGSGRLGRVSGTYSDVDGSSDPAEAVRWQDDIDGWPQVQAYKRRVVELLDGVGPVLDVGCGPGADLVAAGAGRMVGIDTAMTMCAAAAARSVIVCRGDAHALPFAGATFGGVRADRVLQHVSDPAAVVGELVRVVRPGGRIVVAEPDQETLVIHLPGVAPELIDRVKRLRRDVGYRNGRLASSLPAAFNDRGVHDVTVEAFPLVLTDPDDAFGLPAWPELWRDEGGFTDRELAQWHDGVERGRHGGFVYSVTFFVVAGTAA
jgi:SAM-dependent methyltransferase